ncbi:MAG TPA: outer membrane beta-barrel family protein [Saprospiraceae bacterium]|nr:outer membrane beta-barrel family protein [Saprospiraceae bacterium]
MNELKKLPWLAVAQTFVALLLFSTPLAAQPGGKALVKGKLADSVTGTPLGYASVRILQTPENKLVNGALTDESGTFSIELPYGQYVAEIEFIGFELHKTAAFTLSKENALHDLGTIALAATSSNLDEVEVTAEKSTMVLALDKKIFNVGKDLANAGGNATDILTNIPSVSVDPEGNVKLRGSDNVRILIDGKPSGLVSFKGSSGLQQLQASMIERVEIITNPSARYEAEGSAGIINIILKKDNRKGFNGSFEVTAGYPANYGAAANLNYRHRKINFFINYGFSYRKPPGEGELYQEVYANDTTFILLQNNDHVMKGLNNNIRGGLDYFFDEKNILTASYLFRRSDANRISNIRYEDYLFTPDNLQSVTTRTQDEVEDEPNSEYSLIYKKNFGKEGHDLTAEAKYLNYWEHSDQLFTQHTYFPDGTEDFSKSQVQHSLNDEYENQWLFQLDYVHPFSKDGKFEAGVRSSFRDMVNDYVVSEQNASGEFEPLPGLDNYFIYDENINAAYSIVGNKYKKLSWQAGLRLEYTDVNTILRETDEENPRNYFNLFPSAHLTYDLPKENAVQLSYSRRVRRPFYNDLSPFVTYSDSRNYWSGNPDLNPEYSDVFELGHIKYFEKGSMASSVYYRYTDDKIDRIRTVDDHGFSVTQPENLLSEQAFGIEFAGNYTPYQWWKMDGNFNFFHADIDGSNIAESYQATTYSWFARYTTKFMLPKKLDIQLRANYEAPQKTAQGSREALYYFDLTASKDILGGNGTLNLNILDLFNTRRMRTVTEGANFYSQGSFQWRKRQINLTFNYRINQAKQAGKKKSEGEE